MAYGKIDEGHFVAMPKLSLEGETVLNNESDARSLWRELGGWLPVVEDDCPCTTAQIPVYTGYEEDGGAIHHVCTAKAITDATVAELQAAAKAGKINVSKLSATVKADMLMKLLEN